MDFIAELNCVTELFIKEYPVSLYPELMYKRGRPYNCLLIDLHYDYLICIPYRSNINHNNAYHFKNSIRSRENKSGLDYSKMLIINDGKYICSKNVVIDQDEYKETIMYIKLIVRDSVKYLNDYINHMTGKRILNINEFNRKYRYTTLKYFHKILNIE